MTNAALNFMDAMLEGLGRPGPDMLIWVIGLLVVMFAVGFALVEAIGLVCEFVAACYAAFLRWRREVDNPPERDTEMWLMHGEAIGAIHSTTFVERRELRDPFDWTPSCPPCTGRCHQGRDCPARRTT